MKKEIKILRVLIAILLILNITISLMAYRLQLISTRLVKENEKLSKCIEYQKSAIADLEENLKNK